VLSSRDTALVDVDLATQGERGQGLVNRRLRLAGLK
jgi:hypothetical protein